MTPASWPRRFAALFIDWIIATVVVQLALPNLQSPFWSAFAPVIVFWLINTPLVGLFGITVGKRLFRLMVINPDGQPIGLRRAALREFLLCLVVPAVLITDHRRGLHDVVGGSMVSAADPVSP